MGTFQSFLLSELMPFKNVQEKIKFWRTLDEVPKQRRQQYRKIEKVFSFLTK